MSSSFPDNFEKHLYRGISVLHCTLLNSAPSIDSTSRYSSAEIESIIRHHEENRSPFGGSHCYGRCYFCTLWELLSLELPNNASDSVLTMQTVSPVSSSMTPLLACTNMSGMFSHNLLETPYLHFNLPDKTPTTTPQVRKKPHSYMILGNQEPASTQKQNWHAHFIVTDITSDDLRCNVGGLASGPDTSVATVVAGSTVLPLRHSPLCKERKLTNPKVGFALDIAIYHPGPLAVYMSEVTSGFTVQTYDGSGPWFKIAEVGAEITPTAINFADVGLFSYNFTIPTTTPPGAYLLRIEQLALHVAESVGGAQWYLSCAQIVVNGPGGGSPGPTVQIPGVYSATDPGILIDIYYPIPTSYTPPGPAVVST